MVNAEYSAKKYSILEFFLIRMRKCINLGIRQCWMMNFCILLIMN